VQSLQAQALAMAGETDKSRVVFRTAMDNCKTTDQVMIVARQMKASLGEEEAILAVRDMAKGDATARFELARVRLDLDALRYESVVTKVGLLRTVLHDDESKASLARMEGYALMMLDRDEQAAEAYRAALAVDATDISSMNNLAYLLNERLNKPDEAFPLAQKAAERMPDSPNVLDTYGWVLFKQGRIDDSYRVLTQSVERGASVSNVMHLAEAQLARGDERQGHASLRRALALAEKSGETALQAKVQARMTELGMESR